MRVVWQRFSEDFSSGIPVEIAALPNASARPVSVMHYEEGNRWRASLSLCLLSILFDCAKFRRKSTVGSLACRVVSSESVESSQAKPDWPDPLTFLIFGRIKFLGPCFLHTRIFQQIHGIVFCLFKKHFSNFVLILPKVRSSGWPERNEHYMYL